MAASKKNGKGSKTAHVLNLLTAPGTSKESAPAGDETVAEQAPSTPVSRPLLPPILEVAQANDDSLAQQIQQALEVELDEAASLPSDLPTSSVIEEVPSMDQPSVAKILETSGGKMSQNDIEKLLAANAPAEQPAPEAEPAPAPPAASGSKMSQDDIEKLLAAANAPAEQPAQEPEPAPAPPAASGGKMSQDDIEKLLAAANAPAEQPAQEPEKPAPRPPEEKAEPDITYINVMQALVEEKAPRYIKKFGLCSCKQCEADVKALTLTNLVPKYVVLSKIDRIPMLTVYEGRYNSTIFAQLTRACKTVMDHPHHNREP